MSTSASPRALPETAKLSFRLSLSCRDLATEGFRDNDSLAALFVPVGPAPSLSSSSEGKASSRGERQEWKLLDATELVKFSNDPDFVKTFLFMTTYASDSVDEVRSALPCPKLLRVVVFDLGLYRSYPTAERTRGLGLTRLYPLLTKLVNQAPPEEPHSKGCSEGDVIKYFHAHASKNPRICAYTTVDMSSFLKSTNRMLHVPVDFMLNVVGTSKHAKHAGYVCSV